MVNVWTILKGWLDKISSLVRYEDEYRNAELYPEV
jgi:hypothetical protein